MFKFLTERNYIFFLLIFGVISIGLHTSVSWAKVYRISSLGDSITASRQGYASYRYYLWKLITGYNIDFVGTKAGVSVGEPLYPYFDQAHEGHGGYYADDVLYEIDQWINQTNPDVVLCHLGTNDLWSGESVSSTINEISQIIDRIRSVNPNVKILLAQIIPSDFIPTGIVHYFNNEIALLAAQKNTQNSIVVAVDQWTGFNASTDTFDSVHPNDQGEQKIAWKFYTKLMEVLPTPNPTSPEWKDYQVTLKMRSDDNDAIGVMFRVKDNHNYYRFSWDSERSYRRLVKVVDGQFTLLAEDSITYVPGRTYQVKIVADSTVLEVWIDGEIIFSVVDDSIVEGSIALYNWANSAGYFDDVLVESIETGATLLFEDFSEGTNSQWGLVDEASKESPSNWSVSTGALVQNKNIYSLPLDPAELPKLGTYALYEINSGPQYAIMATADAGGTITPSGEIIVNEGGDQSFNIIPTNGFRVLDVIVDGVSLGAITNYTFTNITDAHTIAASFEATGSTIEWTDYQVTVNMRSDDNDAIGVMFRVKDNQNYYRFSWDSERSYRRLVKVVDGQFSLVAEDAVPYVPGRTYQVKIVADNTVLEVWIDGSLIFSVVDESIIEGSIAFYCWGNEGGRFNDVFVESLVSGAVLLSESFSDGLITGWTVADEGNGNPVADWSAATGNLVQSSNVYSMPVDPAHLPKLGTYALYEINTGPTFAITATAGEGGSISPSGEIMVSEGGDQSFSIIPNIGFQVLDLVVDGVSQGATSSYTFTNVTDAHAIEASFEAAGSTIEWTDYQVTVNMRSDDNDAIGVMFRVKDNQNYYRFSWDSERSYRRLVKVVDGQFALLAEDQAPYVPGRTYQVNIVADSTVLEVWIDGSLIFSVVDESIVEGSIAFYCWGNEGGRFNDVLVESLVSGAVLLSENFSNGQITGWTIVDEGTGNPVADWSAATGTLVQRSNVYSLPLKTADLPKLGTYALYQNAS